MKPVQSIPLATSWFDRARDVLPVVVAGLCVAVGVPLFLRMPLWCDLTLYDQAARNLHDGGVHYRDLFDTNTPGFVWVLAAVRGVVGWSTEAIRAVDLLMFAGTVFALDRLAKLGGASGRNRLWMVAGCVGFYLFTEEMVHCQRDVWLAPFALLAVAGRLKRMSRPNPHLLRGVFAPAFLEGLLWAVAVWIKPHFLLVAAGFWGFTAWRLAVGQVLARHPDARLRDRRGRLVAVLASDLGGSVVGGGLLGLGGLAYLVGSGTWEHFKEVMTVWNVGYMESTFAMLRYSLGGWLSWFHPWSVVLPLTVGFVVAGLIDARVWSGRVRPAERGGLLHRVALPTLWFTGGSDEQRYCRAAVGFLYLLWVGQSHFLQRAYMYAHAVEVMLSLAVWAGLRWNLPAVVAAWWLAVAVSWGVNPDGMAEAAGRNYNASKLLGRHPLFDPDRLRLWPRCFAPGPDPADRYRLQDALRYETFHGSTINWEELHEVELYLRGRGVKDRELVCWHDSPHPLYRMLDIQPGTRFMHITTARFIGPEADRKVLAEFHANTAARFVVIDLRRYAFQEATAREREAYFLPGPTADDLLPPAAWWVWSTRYSDLPFVERPTGDEPRYVASTVFRSTDTPSGHKQCGRYVVFELIRLPEVK